MKKRILGCILGVFLVLVTAGGVLAESSGSSVAGDNKLAAGYQVKMHPEGHIALFMKKPLVYTNPHLWAAYILIMFVLGVAALILLYKQKERELDQKLDSSKPADDNSLLALREKHEALLKNIKQLDEQFKSGEVNEQQYRETREKYKELLVRVKLQLKELS